MSKNIQMQEKTSSGYDILYPQTIAAQIEDVYSKDETITTATKALYGLGATATPNQVFSAISTALDGKARIQTGSYVGTGTYGASNPCSLTFDSRKTFFYIWNQSKFAIVTRNYTDGFFQVFLANLTAEYKIIGSQSVSGRYTSVYMKKTDMEITWYASGELSESASLQQNIKNTVYYYLAI